MPPRNSPRAPRRRVVAWGRGLYQPPEYREPQWEITCILVCGHTARGGRAPRRRKHTRRACPQCKEVSRGA